MGALLFTILFLSLLAIGSLIFFIIPDKYTDALILRLGGSNDDSI